MALHIFKKYKYDIALRDGVGAHLVAAVTGLVVFFVTLMLAANIGLAAITQSWVSGLSGSLTVEIKPPAPLAGAAEPTAEQQKDFEAKTDKILWLSKQHPSVSEGRRLTRDEIKALVEPWLGNKISDDLPLPALIDLKLSANADVQKLQSDILALVPAASIDNHDDTLDDVKMLINTARGFLMLLTGVIIGLSIVSVSGIVRSKFSIHKDEAEILHLLGANDTYIARQFCHHTLQGTLKGAIIGVVLTVVTLLAIGAITRAADSDILPRLHLAAGQWALLVLCPVILGAAIAHVTAKLSVMKSLSKLP